MTTPPQSEPSTSITLREVYDLVQEMRLTLHQIVAHTPRIEDHELRIRGLERARWIIAGACLALGTVGGAIGGAIIQ